MAYAKKGVLALLLLIMCAGIFASFEFVAEFNGSNITDSNLANLTKPYGMAIYDGKLYVSSDAMPVIFVMGTDGTLVDRIGATGVQRGIMESPKMLRASNGTLFISDPSKGVVFKYDIRLKTFEVFLPRVWEAKRPVAEVVDGDDYYVVDNGRNQIVQYGYTDTLLKKEMFGTGTFSGQLSAPSDIAIGGGRIFISDKGNNRIAVYSSNWTYEGTYGTGRGGITLNRPEGIAYDNGNLYVADGANNRVVIFGNDGYPVGTIGGEKGNGNYTFDRTTSVVVDGDMLYVADYYNNRVMVYRQNESSLASAFWQRLASANATLGGIGQVYGMVQKVGGVPPQNDFALRIERAAERISDGEYGTASDMLASIEAVVVAENVSAHQQLRLTLQQRLDESKKRIAQISDPADPEVAVLQNQVKNKIVDTQAKIDRGELAQSVDAVLWIASSITELEGTPAGGVENVPGKTGSQQAGPNIDELYLTTLAKAIDNRISNLKDAQAKLNYTQDFSTMETLVSAGESLAVAGNYKDANSTLQKAYAQIEAAEKEWIGAQKSANGLAARMQAAKDALAEGEKWEAFGANMTGVREKINEAGRLIYTDPGKASILLELATGEANEEGGRGSTRALAAGWLAAAMIGIIVVAGTVYWAYGKRRKAS